MTVSQANERAARNSVEALMDMNFSVQLDMEFFMKDHPDDIVGRVCAVRWDRYGRILERYAGDLQKYMPRWVMGTERVKRVQSDSRSISGAGRRSLGGHGDAR